MADDRGPGFGTGLLLGAAIGTLAGLLLAPRPGEETRAQMLERTAGLRGRAEELAVEARERVREAIEEGRAVANRIIPRARRWGCGRAVPGRPRAAGRLAGFARVARV